MVAKKFNIVMRHLRLPNLLKVSFLLLFVSYATFAQGGPGVPSFKKGEQYRKAGDCATAIRYYDEAINLEPIQFVYYVRKGQCLVKLKRYAEAKQAFLKAVEQNKSFTGGYAMLAKLAFKEKNFAEAIKYLNLAYENEGDRTKKLKYKLYVVKLLAKENRANEALNELAKLKQDIPQAANDPRVTTAEGDIYSAMGRWDQAISVYQSALDKLKASVSDRNRLAPYYYKLGLAYYKSGNTQMADQVWANLKGTRYERKAIMVKKMEGAGYFLAVAMGYYKASAYDNALEYAQKGVEKAANPNEKAKAYKLTGFIYAKKGEASQAISYLAKAAQEEKDARKRNGLYRTMIKMQFNNGDYSGALATANKILQANPNNHSILFLKGQAEYQLGQYAAAVATLEKAISSAPQDKRVRSVYNFLLALAAKKSGDVNKAMKALKNASFGALRFAVREEMKKLRSGQ